ncbi:MAG: hypothetical protein A2521_09595 [Deltaproteobacteria bacterium RIFOXYD12_FULL_57_12]|nr:MAG: hypothetical protein A2521_09595 [Deltaproteobacteria bacterium RIFOXYD12_FULL_57_12]
MKITGKRNAGTISQEEKEEKADRQGRARPAAFRESGGYFRKIGRSCNGMFPLPALPFTCRFFCRGTLGHAVRQQLADRAAVSDVNWCEIRFSGKSVRAPGNLFPPKLPAPIAPGADSSLSESVTALRQTRGYHAVIN